MTRWVSRTELTGNLPQVIKVVPLARIWREVDEEGEGTTCFAKTKVEKKKRHDFYVPENAG